MYNSHPIRLFFACLILISLLSACRNEVPDTAPIKNEVVARMSGDPENLNFLLTSDGAAAEIFRYISVPLSNFDPANFQLSPTLIKKMPTIEVVTEGEFKGSTVFDFEILEQATWDNGTPITAHDFLFTLKAVANPNYASTHRGFTGFINKFEIDEQNPKKFRVYGRKYVLAAPVISNFEAMPKHVYDPDGLLDGFTLEELKDKANAERLAKNEKLKAFADKFQSPFHLNDPKGISYAGPYKVEKWITGQELVLIKKKNWWGNKIGETNMLLKASPDKITYKFVADINAAISLAKNGEIDVMGKIPWATFVNLKEDKSITDNFELYTPEKIAYRFIDFNNASPKLEDKRVRQALDYLFNREQIYETVYYGSKTPTVGPIHPTRPYYNKNISVRPFDVNKAKSLLKDAGWVDSDNNGVVDKVIDGEKIEMDIELLYGSGFQDFASLSTIFKNDAIKAGINIMPKTLESQKFKETQKSRNFEAMIAADDWSYPIPKDLRHRFHTRGSQNYPSHSNTEVDSIVSALAKIVDESKMVDGFMRFQEIIHDEVPKIFINTGNDRVIISKKFKNIRVTAVKPHYYLNEFTVNQGVPVTSSNN